MGIPVPKFWKRASRIMSSVLRTRRVKRMASPRAMCPESPVISFSVAGSIS